MGLSLKEKEAKIVQIKLEVDQTHDLMGLGIDSGIKETITYLWALGIKTSGSCEGHLDHGMHAPWIDIGTRMPKISSHKTDIREMMLRKMAVILKRVSVLLDKFYKNTEIYFFIPHTKEMQKRYKLSRQKNLNEQLRFMRLLESFYKDRNVSDDIRLIMETAMGRIISQGARFQEIRPPKERGEKLKNYQEEMKAFTVFLRNKYYGSHEGC